MGRVSGGVAAGWEQGRSWILSLGGRRRSLRSPLPSRGGPPGEREEEGAGVGSARASCAPTGWGRSGVGREGGGRRSGFKENKPGWRGGGGVGGRKKPRRQTLWPGDWVPRKSKGPSGHSKSKSNPREETRSSEGRVWKGNLLPRGEARRGEPSGLRSLYLRPSSHSVGHWGRTRASHRAAGRREPGSGGRNGAGAWRAATRGLTSMGLTGVEDSGCRYSGCRRWPV